MASFKNIKDCKNNMIDFESIRQIVRDELIDEPSGHDYAHTMRVFKNVILIGQTEDVDIEVVKTAALFHDIAYGKRFFKEDYAKTSHDIAKTYLSEKVFTPEQITLILNTIRYHDIWTKYDGESFGELRVLRDADRLDHLGYTGIMRACSYAAFAKKNTISILERLVQMKNEFETKKGKEMSRSRIKEINRFLKGLRAEY
jgi:uncharacterized protein